MLFRSPYKRLNVNKAFMLPIIGLLVLRVAAGRITSILVAPGQPYDDAWMLLNSELTDHFIIQNQPWHMLLIKDMGYPVFLAIVRHLGMYYTDAISLLWFLAAISFTYFFITITQVKHRYILISIFAFVLFSPLAFDSYVGLRVYRNGMLLPLYFVVLSMMGIIFAKSFSDNPNTHLRGQFIFCLVFGFLFTFTYYVKEDGLWLLCCYLAILMICCMKLLLHKQESIKTRLCMAVILWVPILVFSLGTTVYKSINLKYFGVYEINTRTEGELGIFLKNIYNIKSQERNGKIWAPTDAIQKAFEASNTLKSNPKLRDSVLHTKWFGNDITKNPIKGDFLGWVMMSSLSETQTCKSILEQEDYLRKVNREIDVAFQTGMLEKDDRIHLTSSMGGRTLKEILQLRFLLGYQYRTYITMHGVNYLPLRNPLSISPDDKTNHTALISKFSKTTNIDLTLENTNVNLAVIFTKYLFLIYAIAQSMMVVLSLLGIRYGIKKIFIHKENKMKVKLSLVITIGALLLSIIYGTAVGWFSEFVYKEVDFSLRFYGIGMIPMLAMFEIFGSYLFFFNRLNRNHIQT